MTNWSEFYEITRNKPPSPLLVKSLNFVASKNKALDLGAGSLRDTKFLLFSGFKNVIAVDSDPLVIKEGNTINDKRLEIVNISFDSFKYQPGEYDLVSAQFSLPFEVPNKFKDVWNKIKSSIVKNGIFTGQFFGINDEWNISGKKMTFHTKDEVKEMLSGMEIIELTENEEDSRTANGKPKHWHVFNVIARKI